MGRDQGYGATPNQFAKPPGQEMKAIAMAGTGIINGQQTIPSGTQGKPYYGGPSPGAQGGNAYDQNRGINIKYLTLVRWCSKRNEWRWWKHSHWNVGSEGYTCH